MKKFIAGLMLICITFTQAGLPCVEAQLASKVSKDEITRRYSYINIDWWKYFNDDNLIAYINRAFENSPDAKMATIATKEYYQAVKLQFSQELPQAGAGFAPIYYKLPVTNHSDWRFFLPVAVNYEADFFLKNHDKTKLAKKNYEMSLCDEKSAYIGVTTGVAAIYFNLVKLDKLIEIQNKIVGDRKTIYELTQKSYERGLLAQSEVLNAEKAWTGSIIELSDLQKSREQLLNGFALILGESPYNSENFHRTSFESINFTGIIPAEISTEVIENRPDYVRARLAVEKSGLDVRIAKKELLPTFNIAGLALFNAANFGSTFTTTNSLLAFGGGIFQPIFAGGAKVANLRLKKETYERILENYKKTNLVAMQEINDSLVAIKCDEEKYQQTLKQLQLSEKDYKLAKLRYKKGYASRLELLRAQESLLAVEKLAVNQKMDNYINYISLYKSCGAEL